MRRAFTLIELLMAVGLVGVLAVGVGGTLALAVRAVPTAKSVSSGASASASVLARLSTELELATGINGAGPAFIEFVVPDRTGDGADDVIRYEWDGKTPGSLFRTLNYASPQALITDVSDFGLTYRVSSLTTTTAGPWTTLADSVRLTYDGAPLTNVLLSSGVGVGMSVKVPTPAGAFSYDITKVALRIRDGGGGNGGKFRVQIRTADGAGLPTGTILATKQGKEDDLSSSTASFTNFDAAASGLDPSAPICIVVVWEEDTVAAQVATFASAPTDADLYVTSSNSGTSWASSTAKTMALKVNAVVTSSSSTATTAQRLERVDARLKASAPGVPAVNAAVNLPNRPGVS